jgi:hypothetical protein
MKIAITIQMKKMNVGFLYLFLQLKSSRRNYPENDNNNHRDNIDHERKKSKGFVHAERWKARKMGVRKP